MCCLRRTQNVSSTYLNHKECGNKTLIALPSMCSMDMLAMTGKVQEPIGVPELRLCLLTNSQLGHKHYPFI